jgi:alpha-tubulin suppressor-like RCC1 family protein
MHETIMRTLGVSMFLLLSLACQSEVALIPQPNSTASYVLDAEGVLFAWGHNDHGQLGLGHYTNPVYPQKVPLPPGVTHWTSAAAGLETLFAIDQSGRMFSCGANAALFYQLGLGSSNANESTLQLVPFPPGVTCWTRVAGGSATIALADTGEVYVAGSTDLTNVYMANFMSVPLPSTNLQVASGRPFRSVLALDGNLYSWGDNTFGQLGLGYAGSGVVSNPTPAILPAGVTGWLSVVGAGQHTFAVGSDNQVYGWGLNLYGELGLNGTTNAPAPTLVPFPSGVSQWLQTAGGEYHTVALGNNGRVYACGLNLNGYLGTGSTTNEIRFTEVPPPPGVTQWTGVGAGRYHTLAQGDDGQLYAWGYGGYGALGNGTLTAYQTTPTPVDFRPLMKVATSPSLRLEANTLSGTTWILEGSTDLLIWTAIATNTAHQGSISFEPSQAATRQFYRLVEAP